MVLSVSDNTHVIIGYILVLNEGMSQYSTEMQDSEILIKLKKKKYYLSSILCLN